MPEVVTLKIKLEPFDVDGEVVAKDVIKILRATTRLMRKINPKGLKVPGLSATNPHFKLTVECQE